MFICDRHCSTSSAPSTTDSYDFAARRSRCSSLCFGAATDDTDVSLSRSPGQSAKHHPRTGKSRKRTGQRYRCRNRGSPKDENKNRRYHKSATDPEQHDSRERIPPPIPLEIILDSNHPTICLGYVDRSALCDVFGDPVVKISPCKTINDRGNQLLKQAGFLALSIRYSHRLLRIHLQQLYEEVYLLVHVGHPRLDRVLDRVVELLPVGDHFVLFPIKILDE